MNLLEFQNQFASEQDCIDYLIEVRWPKGWFCQHCQCKEHWYLPTRRYFECKQCRKQQSVTSETMFHRSHSPLLEWFWAIFLMCQSKKGISTLELQRLLGAKDYRRVAHMQGRIREAMENRESLYQLEGFAEVDESFFGGSRPGGKKGRGAKEDKAVVLVSASVNEANELQFAKMKVIGDTQGTTLVGAVKEVVKPGSIVKTDGWDGYNDLSRQGYPHYAKVMRFPEQNQEHLPWAHILISNAKRFILGTHHSVTREKLQGYLNEFCYRLNRRFFNVKIFERMILASVSYNPCIIRS
jgi:transposase-like protein